MGLMPQLAVIRSNLVDGENKPVFFVGNDFSALKQKVPSLGVS